MRFHHIGIPTTDTKEGERYSAESRLFITSMDDHPYRVEWLRFEADSPLPKVIQTVAHVGFEVEDLERAIDGKEILVQPKTLPNGIRIAFICEGGAPVEFLQMPDST